MKIKIENDDCTEVLREYHVDTSWYATETLDALVQDFFSDDNPNFKNWRFMDENESQDRREELSLIDDLFETLKSD